MPGQRALLSPSGAERWLHCTAAPRTEEKLPEEETGYAREGTLAHAIAERKLRKEFTPMGMREFHKQMKPFKADPLYQEEMQKYTDIYRDFVKETAMGLPSAPYVALEVRVDISGFAPECFGRSDCVLIYGSTLHVIDFKYGKGVAVSAVQNPQMMLYALGAIKTYLPVYGDSLTNIRMTVVQPRLDSISDWLIGRNELIDWGVKEVRPKAQAAFDGKGEFAPGEWCRFCRARNVCKARAGDAVGGLEGVPQDDPDFLTPEQLGDYLARGKRLSAWVSNVEDYALSALLKGSKIPGWKAVEGRSNRKISDVDKAFDVLRQHGHPDAVLFERVPLALTKLETQIGKKELAELCGDYIIKPPGKPTLAPESDKRPAFGSAAADFEGITN